VDGASLQTSLLYNTEKDRIYKVMRQSKGRKMLREADKIGYMNTTRVMECWRSTSVISDHRRLPVRVLQISYSSKSVFDDLTQPAYLHLLTPRLHRVTGALLILEIRSMERCICPIAVFYFALKRSFFNI